MKSTPLILAAGVVFGAIYGTNALLPDMYDNPTSEVKAGSARIPGLSCLEEDGSTTGNPRWDCDGTQIRAKEAGVQDKDKQPAGTCGQWARARPCREETSCATAISARLSMAT